jgi:hypothetical protein
MFGHYANLIAVAESMICAWRDDDVHGRVLNRRRLIAISLIEMSSNINSGT